MRQHATPIILSESGQIVAATELPLGLGGHGESESSIQDIVQRFPLTLPIEEIDPLFRNPVPICREMGTPAGAIDNVLVTPTGLPILVECKLWKNPEGRREVIGQILDYSKELSRWTSSDFQREASRRLARKGNVVFDLVREAGHEVEEIAFNDALSFNLRRGRFLLLIVGDGIREGVESIVEYVQSHTGLHFTLGLVEMPIYALPNGDRLVVPRVLARTTNIVRMVIDAPDGTEVVEDGDTEEVISARNETPERRAGRERRNAIRQAFWQDFLAGLQLDDPEQAKPSPALGGHVVFKFGAPGGSSWLTVYRDMRANRVGLFLSGNANSIGDEAAKMLEQDAVALRDEIGRSATVEFAPSGYNVSDSLQVGDLENPSDRAVAISWLQERTNAFVNAVRPRIRSALRELQEDLR